MKFLLTDDWHLRVTTPEFRSDNYTETLYGKVEQIYRIAKQQQCDYILNAGDLFHQATAPYSLTQRYMELFLRWNRRGVRHLVVAGQHDMRYHSSDLTNTPIYTLHVAGAVELLTANPFYTAEDVHIYGASWQEPIPVPENPKAINILVMHAFVSNSEVNWAPDCLDAWELLRDNPNYRLIVTGDNHKRFSTFHTPQSLVNAGSIMRSNTDQIDHRPSVYIYDTDNFLSLERYCLQIRPANEVFHFDRIETRQERTEQDVQLENLMTRLQNAHHREELGYDFVANLRAEMEHLPPEVITAIEEALPR